MGPSEWLRAELLLLEVLALWLDGLIMCCCHERIGAAIFQWWCLLAMSNCFGRWWCGGIVG